MKTEDFPQDIVDAAWRAVDRWYGGAHEREAHTAACYAIMAERERCSKLADDTAIAAEKFAKERLANHSIDIQRWAEGCRQVARDIKATPSTTPEVPAS